MSKEIVIIITIINISLNINFLRSSTFLTKNIINLHLSTFIYEYFKIKYNLYVIEQIL